MEKKIKISYRKGVHRGEERLLLDIPYENDIIEKVKMIPGRKWSKTKSCWHGMPRIYLITRRACATSSD